MAYFVIAYLGTWLVDLPVLLGKGGLGLFPFSFGDASILVVFLSAYSGPLLATFLVTAKQVCGPVGRNVLLIGINDIYNNDLVLSSLQALKLVI